MDVHSAVLVVRVWSTRVRDVPQVEVHVPPPWMRCEAKEIEPHEGEVQGSSARKDAYEEGERWMPVMHVLMLSVGVLGRVRDGGARIDEKEVDAVTSPRW